ncbi:MAG: radical SAM family heme chaperone HemW [Pseudomonadota bacterium]
MISLSPQESPDPGFGLYVHWPFCLAKCPYCDFNSHVREAVDHRKWARALISELDHYAHVLEGKGPRHLTSIFFGGGTPSLMEPESVAAVIEAAQGHWSSDPDLEITLEANPTSSEAERFQAFAQAGVNRLSIGVQSLDNEALRFLGRQHSATEARAAVDLARQTVQRFSFDMIYARPGQDLQNWKKELATALALGPAHISLYQLTIESGTAFELEFRRGDFTLPPEDEASAFFDETRALLDSQGLPAYEVSNHARPGEACRHNLTYWRYGDYVGIGPGAHGRLTTGLGKISTRQHRLPESWLDAVSRQGHATTRRQILSRKERLDELVMMGLRLSEGIPTNTFVRETGQTMETCLSHDRLNNLCSAGLLDHSSDRLRATNTGLSVLDSVLAYLLIDENPTSAAVGQN